MPRKSQSAYDEEPLTPEEEAAVAESDKSTDLPPPDSEEGAPKSPAEEAPAAEAKPAADEKPAAEAKPAEAPAASPQPTEEDEFNAFLDQHKGKSPEEIARLAFQQQKRANKGEATARVANRSLERLAERAKAALDRRAQLAKAAPDARQSFRDRLKEDPDAATADLHDRLVAREIADADVEADKALFDEAMGFANNFVPGFSERYPKMRSLAAEIGYSDQEMDGVRDGRDLVVLSLAQLAADMIKAGIIDPTGKLIAIPEPTTEAKDPRLTVAEPVKTLGSTGARSSDGAPSTEEALANLLSMSDADFDKMSEEEINNILRAA